MKQSSLARSVRHKIFGFPNGTRIFHGLGFHINYYQFKQLLGLPDNMEPLGYFLCGKTSYHYDNQPMLQQLNWKQKQEIPLVEKSLFCMVRWRSIF
jgi:hypothetical protein